jgi:hypothetical protein
MWGKGFKAVAALAAVLVALQLGACNGDSSTTGTTTAVSVEESAPEPSAPPSEVNEQLRRQILSFGEKGSEAELEAAAAVVRGYLVARASENSARTCSYLSRYMLAVVKGVSSQQDERGCAAGVERLAGLSSRDDAEGQVRIDPTGLRHRGRRAFVIYTDRYGDAYAMLMRPEGGAWKIQGFEPTRLS